MPRQYTISDYIEAAEELGKKHGLVIKTYQGKKNAIGFKVFTDAADAEPIEVWVVHTTHGPWKSRKIWSKEDLKKPARNIKGATQEEFEKILAEH